MGSRESSGAGTVTSISSDADLRVYLNSEIQKNEMPVNQEPAVEYISRRNFQIEPLENTVAEFLIQAVKAQLKATAVDSQSLCCWAPIKDRPLEVLKTRLQKWGYAVVSVRETDTRAEGFPVVEIGARQSPSSREQLRVLAQTGLEADVLLDGWMTVIQNRHRREADLLSYEVWADWRGVESDVVRTNILSLRDALKEDGGIPGTQWAINHSGGVPVETPGEQSST